MYLPLQALQARFRAYLQLLGMLLGCVAFTQSADAAPETCQTAARVTAFETGIPEEVLVQLARTNWDDPGGVASPWAVTMTGEATRHFGTQDAALAYLYARFIRGARHFLVGCFHVSYDPFSSAFPSIEAMFEPKANARQAAKILLGLHRENRTWTSAISAYHARSPNVAAAAWRANRLVAWSLSPSDRRASRSASTLSAT